METSPKYTNQPKIRQIEWLKLKTQWRQQASKYVHRRCRIICMPKCNESSRLGFIIQSLQLQMCSLFWTRSKNATSFERKTVGRLRFAFVHSWKPWTTLWKFDMTDHRLVFVAGLYWRFYFWDSGTTHKFGQRNWPTRALWAPTWLRWISNWSVRAPFQSDVHTFKRFKSQLDYYNSTSNNCECVCFWLYTTTEHGDLIIHAALAKAKPSEPRLGNEKEEKLLLAHEFWILQKEQDFVWFVTEHWSQVFVQCAHSRLLRHVQYVSSPLDWIPTHLCVACECEWMFGVALISEMIGIFIIVFIMWRIFCPPAVPGQTCVCSQPVMPVTAPKFNASVS